MSRHIQLDRNKILKSRVYPLPPEHPAAGRNVSRPSARRKLRLDVNEQTGRVQWCPGMTCCKFLIILPVVMLPILLVLILVMRMDGMLLALRLQSQGNHSRGKLEHTQESADNAADYGGSLMDENGSEQLMWPNESRSTTEAERLKRCVSPNFGLMETVDVEDRDIMRDARTSFLPQDLIMAIPRECLNYGNSYSSADDYKDAGDPLKKRKRSTKAHLRNFIQASVRGQPTSGEGDMPESSDNGAFGSIPEVISDDDEVKVVQMESALQSFWTEAGSREKIRETQAKTMRQYINRRIDPCDDFYKYACGNWERLHPIPKDKAGFDTFEMLRENLDAVLKKLLEAEIEDDRRTGHNNQISQPLASNSYDLDTTQDIKADIKDTVSIATLKLKRSIAELQTQHDTQLLRHHIVRRRRTLGRILTRYKRQSTNSKRKRLFGRQNARVVSPQPNANPEPSAQLKAKYLYQSCVNTKLLQKRGIEPLLQLIEQLGGWPVLDPNWNPDNFDWLNLTAQLRRYNNDILIVQWVGPDIKNSDENVIQFDQTSLGLPTREYFLQESNARYLQAYERFMAETMERLGAPRDVAFETAAELVAFETQLASITSPAEERLNVTKLYKRMTLKQLHNVVPEINWVRYLTILQERNVKDSEQVVIYAVDYMQDLVALLEQTKPSTVSNYLLWRFARHRINNVDNRFEDIKQNFYHTLFGREESPERWKVCIAQVNTNMGMALGCMFVKKYFDENSKRDTLKMTHELQQAFRDILKQTDWIDPSTKHLAELKVNAMSLKIGYPDFILNPKELNEKYAGIDIRPDTYFENTLHVLLHTARTEQTKLTESVNKTTWQTAPAIVNAYYSRNKNQIMFPAGILQPPFYHRHFPRALNFGGIGVVIGHELTHGFDDKGRLFDRNGSIHKWWTDASIRGFDERARCIIEQYSNYTVEEVGIALNGESTQGENIADNGGIREAFHAYKHWLNENPSAAADETMPGLNMTGEQLFFLNFGQVWCGAMRPEAIRNKLNTAIHSPGRFRVIGTLSNSYDFAREFNCPVGSRMNPERKCSVW